MIVPNAQDRWPGRTHCVVTLAVDFDGPSVEVGRKIAPLGAHAHGRYAAKRGVPRYLDLFDRHAVPATFFVPGYDAELYGNVVGEIARRGYEVGAHGYLHEGWDLGDAEAGALEKTHTILTGIVGRPPRGWRSPSGQKSVRTMRILKALGYVYDSSDKDLDLPYLAHFDGTEHRDFVMLPNNTSSLDDFPFYRVSYTPPSEVLVHWRQEFDAIYAEGGYLNLTVHPRAGYGSGSPARVRVVDDLIAHIKRRPDVRFMGMLELARWCLAHPDRWRRDWAAEGLGVERRSSE